MNSMVFRGQRSNRWKNKCLPDHAAAAAAAAEISYDDGDKGNKRMVSEDGLVPEYFVPNKKGRRLSVNCIILLFYYPVFVQFKQSGL